MQPCPRCGRIGRYLEYTSSVARFDYYRCDECGIVWCLDRSHPNEPPQFVTVPPEPKKDKQAS